jgi:hypothetical protein
VSELHLDSDPDVRAAAFAVLLCHDPVGLEPITTTLGWDEERARAAAVRLEDDGFLSHELRPTSTRRLFNELARAWCCDQPEAPLARAPGPSLGRDGAELLMLGLNNPENEPGWALAGSLAASAWGIPVVVANQIRHFYAPSEPYLRLAQERLGRASGAAGAFVRVTPMFWITRHRIDGAKRGLINSEWPVVHPLVSALEVAGTDSHVLDGWKDIPPEVDHRPWDQP